MVQILHDTPFRSDLSDYYQTKFVIDVDTYRLIDSTMFRPLLQVTLDEIRLDIINWNVNDENMLVWSPENPRSLLD
jgi:hypothetical protein